ncbi:MAG: sulfatase-like hydrolase/transferase [Roseibium sp.]|uniref:sulfatase-like hydrolase/transferase n=1 Tax=Roseibium sp. TaxID=1936156 RepID=UPI00260C3DF0|nr:sulfatase-like hydrolase/transferase [Roseibium sp.]MCV0429521.1 sulfatase-like hydrolase/transferase [Roseibium sp.]
MHDNRNVLFIIIDQLRADCVFGELADYVDLPNLRAFAEEAVSFRQHYSVVNPCGPSRASILTGQYAMNHRSVRNGTPLRHDTPNLATEMRKSGYMPLLFGYTDTSQDPRHYPADDPALRSYEFPMTGFHEVTEMRLETSYPWQSYLINKGYKFNTYWDVYKPVSPDGGVPKLNDPAMYAAKDSDTAFLTDAFLAAMPAYAKESWFAHLTYVRPHPPLVAPAPFNDMYPPEALPLPNRLDTKAAEAALHRFFVPAIKNASVASFVEGFPDLVDTDDTIKTLRAIYLGLASEVDQHIRRVLRFLKDSGQYDDTLIVITADHGEMLGDRYSWGKTNVYDAAYHTPLIVRVPGQDEHAGQVIQEFTESIDLSPTILDWVGQDIPNSMDGRSLLPFLQGRRPDDWRTYAYAELDFGDPLKDTRWQEELGTNVFNSSLCRTRDDRFTLVEFAADLPPMLFDHAKSGEMENVADQPEYQADLNRLTRRMLRHQMRFRDQTLSLSMITPNGPVRLSRHDKSNPT